MSRSRILILAAGDLALLLLFILLGQIDHSTLNESNPIAGALPTFAPLAIAWLVIAFLLRAFPREPQGLASFLAHTLLAWLIAAPLGLLLRATLLDRTVATPFLLVTLGLGGLMLLTWRAVFWLLAMRRRGKTRL